MTCGGSSGNVCAVIAVLAVLKTAMSFPKFSRQFFDYIPTLVDICPRDVDIFLS